MRKRKRNRPSIARPSLGRNLAVRPGAGAHASDEEKRAADRLRREIEEQERERSERDSSGPEHIRPAESEHDS
jgi:hypothetical protein